MWRQRAACAGLDPAIFYPEERTRKASGFEEARRICAQCTVRRECLNDALEMGDTHGFRGGLPPHELTRLYVQRQRYIRGMVMQP